MDATGELVRGSAIGVFQPSRQRLDKLGAWYAAEYESLLRFAYLVTGDAAHAEDLVQEAFVRMYRAGARAERTGIKSYARATILNLARNAFRRRVREHGSAREPGSARAHGAHGATGAVEAPDTGARDEVWRALGALSARQRACVVLRFYEDMSERDVAATLGMSPGSVKKHTSRALAKLRDVLGRQS